MAIIDTLRPIFTRKTGGGIAVPSGTLDEVTADDDDATYIEFPRGHFGDTWGLRAGRHAPPANRRRPRIRGRIRLRTDAGSSSEDSDLGRGEPDWSRDSTVSVNDTFSEQASDWFQNPEYG